MTAPCGSARWRSPACPGGRRFRKSLSLDEFSCDSGARRGRNGIILPPWRAAFNHDLTQWARLADDPAGLDPMKSGLPVAQGTTTAPLPARAKVEKRPEIASGDSLGSYRARAPQCD